MTSLETLENTYHDSKAYRQKVISRAFAKATSTDLPNKVGRALADDWKLTVEFPPVALNKNPLRLAIWALGGLGYVFPFQTARVREIELNPDFQKMKTQLQTMRLGIADIQPYKSDAFYCAGVNLMLKPL